MANASYADASNVVEQLHVIGQREHLYLTMQGPSVHAATFGRDNWGYLPDYWRRERAFLRETVEDRVPEVLMVRQFTHLRCPDSDLPMKRVSAALLLPDRVVGLPAEIVRDAARTDAQTGAPIREPCVTFVSFVELARLIGLAAPPGGWADQ